jgi:hypothetical protein
MYKFNMMESICKYVIKLLIDAIFKNFKIELNKITYQIINKVVEQLMISI